MNLGCRQLSACLRLPPSRHRRRRGSSRHHAAGSSLCQTQASPPAMSGASTAEGAQAAAGASAPAAAAQGEDTQKRLMERVPAFVADLFGPQNRGSKLPGVFSFHYQDGEVLDEAVQKARGGSWHRHAAAECTAARARLCMPRGCEHCGWCAQPHVDVPGLLPACRL